jgi:ribokinase
MNLDIATIGSATLDVFLKSSSFTVAPVDDQLMVCEIYGGKMDVEDAFLSSGGASTNTAVSFARQGYATACIAEVGMDIAAQVVWDDLAREKVNTSFLIQEESERTAISSLLVAGDGSRSAMTFRGASHQLEIKDIPFDELAHVRAIHLSSVGDIHLIKAISDHCVSHNIFFSWNPSKHEVEEIFLRSQIAIKPNVMFVNDQEWATIERVENTVRSNVEMVLITRGKKGGEVLIEGKKISYTAKIVENVVDETGAGDAFASAFTGAKLKGSSIEECLHAGVENAASVVQHLGAKTGLLPV